MQDINSTLCFIQGLHDNKPKSFGLLALLVGNYFRVLDFANGIEEVEEVALCGIVRQVANV